MKLILCLVCHDVFKLVRDERTCECGRCSGWVHSDGLNAEYDGKDAVPLGFANQSLVDAVFDQPKSGQGKVFTAFVIPKKCPTLRRTK